MVNNQSNIRSAGLRVTAASHTAVNNCHIDNNQAQDTFGGGIANAGTTVVNDGTINGNQAATDGGGIANLGGNITLNGPVMQGNYADSNLDTSGSGGAIFNLAGATVNVMPGTVIGASGHPNVAQNGGGIANEGTINVNQAQIVYNTAAGNGGGLSNSSAMSVDRVRFDHNSATGNGGGVYLASTATGEAANSLFTGNSAAAGGGAYGDSTGATVVNSTFHGNSSGVQFADSSLLRNVIAYGNGVDCAGAPGAQFSLFGAGTCAVNGVGGSVVGFNPLFVDAAGGNFALNASSPAIDGGSSAFAAAYASDYAGGARLQGSSVDMGAIESAYATVVSLSASDDTASEDGSDTGSYTLTRTGSTAGELTVVIDVTGSAAAGDYGLTVAGTPVSGVPLNITFPANQTMLDIVLTGVDDLMPESSETVILTLQDGEKYNLMPQTAGTVTLIDDEVAGVVVSQTLGSTDVAEGGAPDSFTISLTSIPTNPVTVTLTHDPADFTIVSDPDGSVDVVLDGQTMIQTVDVEAVNDDLVEGLENGTITLTVASADSAYNSLAVAPVAVSIADNDTAEITFAAATANAPENATPYTADVELTIVSDPAGGSLAAPLQVMVGETAGTAATPADYALTTTLASFSVGAGSGDTAAVAVAIVSDSVDEADETFNLTFGTITGLPVGTATASGTQQVTIVDDDTAGVSVNPTSGLVTSEAGSTATFDVVLSSQPTADVTIALSSSDTAEGTVQPAITFTSANWATPQTVTLIGVDDSIDDGDVAYTIITTVASGDVSYNALAAPDVSVTNADDDTAGVNVNPMSGLVTTEAGGTDTFSVILVTQPEADVTINLSSSDTTEGTVQPAITFTSANWATPQTVTVTGVNDSIDDGDIAYTIVTTVTSGDAHYNNLAAADVNVTNGDDDSAGLDASPSSGLITTEAGGFDTFDVVLTSQPAADVTVHLISNDTTEGVVGTTQITFTSANCSTPVAVQVTGQDDAEADGSIVYTISLMATSGDTHYNNAAASVSATNSDDDAAGITIAPTSGLVTTEAGGTATFGVVLSSQPAADVTVALASSDTTEGTVPAAISFTPANWSAIQTVTVSGVDDSIDDGDIAYTIVTTISSGDALYNALAAPDVGVTNADDDTAGVNISPTSGLVTTEAGGTATFGVVLTSQPAADVTVALASSDPTEGTVPAAISFTPANWNVSQTVTVSGVDDAVDDGDIAYSIVTTVSSGDALYNALAAPDVGVTNTDDDTAGVNISPTSGLVTTEAGGTATFSVVLTSQPTADVTIALVSSDITEGTVPAAITFSSASWNVSQTVTVTGVNDAVDDGDIAYTIVTTVTSGDAGYNNPAAADVSVTNTDDDAAGVSIAPTSGLVTTEAGGTATFNVVLTSQPTADVTVALISSDTTEGAVPPSITFTSADWATSQVVTVTGADDALDDGDIAYTITTTVSSADSGYHGLAAPDVSATNMDDDAAGVSIAPDQRPRHHRGRRNRDVQRRADQPADGGRHHRPRQQRHDRGAVPPSITFTSADWASSQVITVTGADDALDDGDIAYTIVTTVSSADSGYDQVAASDVAVTNADDYSAGVLINPTSGLVTTEAGGTATFSVVLTTQPIADVTVALSSSDMTEGTAPTSITFTSADWNAAQTITLTGVDDTIDDGDVAYSIVTAVASADPLYNNVDAADVGVTNSDDDSAGISIAPLELTGPENGPALSYQIFVQTAPSQPFTLAVSFDPAQVAVNGSSRSPALITFTSGGLVTVRC
ncbi:MAG: hypothetical protein IPK19_05295 [Chloroflexi bacterium]|nr:hypothetical protein [Chloroflexota bacterium]